MKKHTSSWTSMYDSKAIYFWCLWNVYFIFVPSQTKLFLFPKKMNHLSKTKNIISLNDRKLYNITELYTFVVNGSRVYFCLSNSFSVYHENNSSCTTKVKYSQQFCFTCHNKLDILFTSPAMLFVWFIEKHRKHPM